jgi:hypothetical protein
MMKKPVVLFVFLAVLLVGCGLSKEEIVQTAIAQTQEANPTIAETARPTATDTPSPTITSSPAPSEIQFFRDNNIMKQIISDHPTGVCKTTESGWECYQELSGSGRWYLTYFKDSDSDAEVYQSEYLDISGLNEDGVKEVFFNTVPIINNESIMTSVIEWLMGEGFAQATQEDAGGISKEFGEINVFFSFSNMAMLVSLCHGEWCN